MSATKSEYQRRKAVIDFLELNLAELMAKVNAMRAAASCGLVEVDRAEYMLELLRSFNAADFTKPVVLRPDMDWNREAIEQMDRAVAGEAAAGGEA